MNSDSFAKFQKEHLPNLSSRQENKENLSHIKEKAISLKKRLVEALKSKNSSLLESVKNEMLSFLNVLPKSGRKVALVILGSTALFFSSQAQNKGISNAQRVTSYEQLKNIDGEGLIQENDSTIHFYNVKHKGDEVRIKDLGTKVTKRPDAVKVEDVENNSTDFQSGQESKSSTLNKGVSNSQKMSDYEEVIDNQRREIRALKLAINGDDSEARAIILSSDEREGEYIKEQKMRGLSGYEKVIEDQRREIKALKSAIDKSGIDGDRGENIENTKNNNQEKSSSLNINVGSKTYHSYEDAAKAAGVSVEELKANLKLNSKKSTNTPNLKEIGDDVPVTINGKEYRNIRDAAVDLGVTIQELRNRSIIHGEFSSQESKPSSLNINVGGKTYHTYEDAARAASDLASRSTGRRVVISVDQLKRDLTKRN